MMAAGVAVTPGCLVSGWRICHFCVRVTSSRVGAVTVEVRGVAAEGDLAADRAKVAALRRGLGAQLVTYRAAAGISQPQLGQAVGRTAPRSPRSNTAPAHCQPHYGRSPMICAVPGVYWLPSMKH
jgi:hypothetical protein